VQKETTSRNYSYENRTIQARFAPGPSFGGIRAAKEGTGTLAQPSYQLGATGTITAPTSRIRWASTA